MDWKSTVDISRNDAIALIVQVALQASNSQLESALEAIGVGDDSNLPHYGCNFSISDNKVYRL